eukprot:s1955_g5.t1
MSDRLVGATGGCRGYQRLQSSAWQVESQFCLCQLQAHCCDQPERCFGPDSTMKNATYDECCGPGFQKFMKIFLSKVVRVAEDTEELREMQTIMKAYLIFVNSLDTTAWELAAQVEGKLAISHYNSLTMHDANHHLGIQGFMKKRLAIMKDL